MGKVDHVVVHIAMLAEANPMIEAMGLKELASDPFPGVYPARAFQGSVGGAKVTVVANGTDAQFGVDCVGTVNAALVAHLICTALSPDIVVNAGTAGAFSKRGGAIGDVYVASAFKNHDRRVSLPGFDVWGVGEYPAHATPGLVSALGLKLGVVTTGNSLDMCDTDGERMDANGADVKEMEAAAIAQVCKCHGVPLVAIKAVTDIVDADRPSPEQFMENLGSAAKALQKAVPEAVAFLAGKELGSL